MFNDRFFSIFKRFCEIYIFGEKTGHQAISEFNFESFLKFPHFLKSSLLLLLLLLLLLCRDIPLGRATTSSQGPGGCFHLTCLTNNTDFCTIPIFSLIPSVSIHPLKPLLMHPRAPTNTAQPFSATKAFSALSSNSDSFQSFRLLFHVSYNHLVQQHR